MLHGLNSSSRRVLSDLKRQIDQGHHDGDTADEIPEVSKYIEPRRGSSAAQRIGRSAAANSASAAERVPL
jgi:hypothetical protein